MSLRMKLYLAFLVMILLVVFTGAMAVRAFWRTNKRVEEAQRQVRLVDNILVPTNQLVTQVYTDVNQAALFFHAYGYNRIERDFEEGSKNLKQILERTTGIERLVAMPDNGRIANAKPEVEKAKQQTAALSADANDLRASMQKADKLQEEVDKKLAVNADVLNALYEHVMEDVIRQLGDEDAGMTAGKEKLIAEWQFLDEFYNAVTGTELLFWKSRSKYGDEAAAQFREVIQLLGTQRDQLRAFLAQDTIQSAAARANYEKMLNLLDEYTGTISAFADEWTNSGRMNDKMTVTAEALQDTFDQLDQRTAELTLSNTKQALAATSDIDAIVDRSTKGSFVILIIAAIIGVLLAYFITKSIVDPINGVIDNLSHEEEVIGNAASQIGHASQDLSEGVTEQAASIEETSSAVEEMSAMTKRSADNAQDANNTTRDTLQLVTEGAGDMREMSAAMAKINEQADRISNIIKTIEEIAFQTNLLALNAAVEAARAGEAGKGFAVVADEVRNLSGRSAQAAKDTSDLINATVESVHDGSSILDRLNASYGNIEKGITDINQLIGQIAGAAGEQSQGVEQINSAMSQMNVVTQRNANGAAESASSVDELESQITDLRNNILSLQAIIYGKKVKRLGGPPERRKKKNKKEKVPPSRQLVMTPDMIE